MERVLQGFHFVGAFPQDDWRQVDSAPHSRTPWPASWSANLHYVFHLDVQMSVEDLAILTLPHRLRTAGYEVFWAPGSPGDMAVPSMGNPQWSIAFRQSSYRGEMHGRLDRTLYDSLRCGQPSGRDARIDDLVVTFQT
jgi:hypothetical protein